MSNLPYIGTALRYPVEVNSKGGIQVSSDARLLRESIVRLLGTPIGTIFFNRGYGSRLGELIFEPSDDVLFSLLDYHIKDAVGAWEKRVANLSINIEINDSDESRIDVSLRYTILSSNEVDSFVFPFYKELKN
jgi:phage baseplate assembly protein W